MYNLKHLKKYFSFLKKYSLLSSFFLLFLLFLLIFYTRFTYEHFDSSTSSSSPIKDPNDLLYVKLYNEVFSYDKLYQTDFKNITDSIEKLFANQIKNQKEKKKDSGKLRILDAGVGVGKHYELFYHWLQSNYPEWTLDGVEYSDSFLKIAKLRIPDGSFKDGDLKNMELYPASSFDVIICLYDTIHHNSLEEQEKIFENFYYWLKPNGVIYIHFFNPKQLDPAPMPFSQYYTDKNNKKHAQTYFDDFVHDAYWIKKENTENQYDYIQQFILPNGHKKVKIHTFTIPDRSFLLSKMKYYGFKPIDVIDMKKIGAEIMDLYIFKKQADS
jgi:SAM-dependent methyltransferase